MDDSPTLLISFDAFGVKGLARGLVFFYAVANLRLAKTIQLYCANKDMEESDKLLENPDKGLKLITSYISRVKHL